jgi:D-alanyl-lipoteichoic acid acyltransferase DltB (MBOAT superfamily)
MARGVALAMGFRLMRNFDHPYLASSVGDFWSRWHISLSTWFRDYLYIPLGGSRHGEWITCRNLALVFVISGLWHGASWTFVIWGAIHAAGAIATRFLERTGGYAQIPLAIKRLGVFIFVCFGWIFFRAESLSDAGTVLWGMFNGPWSDPECPLLMVGLVLVLWWYEWLTESSYRSLLESAFVKVAMAVGMILYLTLAASGGGEFIYFQF